MRSLAATRSAIIGATFLLALATAPVSSQCFNIRSGLSDGPNAPVSSGPCTFCGASVYWTEPGSECRQAVSMLPHYFVTCQRGTCSIGPGPCLCMNPTGDPYLVTTAIIQCQATCTDGDGGPSDPGA